MSRPRGWPLLQRLAGPNQCAEFFPTGTCRNFGVQPRQDEEGRSWPFPEWLISQGHPFGAPTMPAQPRQLRNAIQLRDCADRHAALLHARSCPLPPKRGCAVVPPGEVRGKTPSSQIRRRRTYNANITFSISQPTPNRVEDRPLRQTGQHAFATQPPIGNLSRGDAAPQRTQIPLLSVSAALHEIFSFLTADRSTPSHTRFSPSDWRSSGCLRASPPFPSTKGAIHARLG